MDVAGVTNHRLFRELEPSCDTVKKPKTPCLDGGDPTVILLHGHRTKITPNNLLKCHIVHSKTL